MNWIIIYHGYEGRNHYIHHIRLTENDPTVYALNWFDKDENAKVIDQLWNEDHSELHWCISVPVNQWQSDKVFYHSFTAIKV